MKWHAFSRAPVDWRVFDFFFKKMKCKTHNIYGARWVGLYRTMDQTLLRATNYPNEYKNSVERAVGYPLHATAVHDFVNLIIDLWDRQPPGPTDEEKLIIHHVLLSDDSPTRDTALKLIGAKDWM